MTSLGLVLLDASSRGYQALLRVGERATIPVRRQGAGHAILVSQLFVPTHSREHER